MPPGNEVERCKAREIGDGVKLFFNGKDTKRNGVAIAESLEGYGSAVNRISDRIMVVRIDTKEEYWTVLSVYAPQTGCPESEKDESYISLDDAVRAIPESDYLTIAGALNGYVSSDRRDCSCPTEDARATSAIVWICTEEATRSSYENSYGLRGGRQATTRSSKKAMRDVIKKDLSEVTATKDDALDRAKWRRLTKTADPASAQD
ncbi:hypothetical protein TELCIR_06169 [Teladorsagia circumcincta]|uniref:Uncharacterized protein n=1 Tax=Teladorsagia circumcincta TaxID=45464 RepID=A0A2G9UQB7_TELCI|nr:hypothetical protein TELCIR_06169 [Teladorsagia circumcincta]